MSWTVTLKESVIDDLRWFGRKDGRMLLDEARLDDLYTLLWLVREYESHRAEYTDLRYAQAKAVSATPAQSVGLTPAFAADGPVSEATHDGVRCWRISGTHGGQYLYFDVDDAFYQSGSGPLEIALEFLDQGTGRIVLQYDSTDTTATLSGAYKSHTTVVDCGNTDGWRSVAFTVPDARFAGAQNGDADFRVYSNSDNLLIRRARVTRR